MKSIMQVQDDRCYLCQMAVGTQDHHIFGAANRKHSEEDGLKVRVCAKCHDKIHFSPKDGGKTNLELHKAGQAKYEETHSREEFMKRYGRNYL